MTRRRKQSLERFKVLNDFVDLGMAHYRGLRSPFT